MPDEKKSYHVHTPVLHDKRSEPGDKIELTESEAAPLLASMAIRHHEPTPEEEQEQAVVLESLTKAQLVQYAEGEGLKLDANLNKADYLVALKEALK